MGVVNALPQSAGPVPAGRDIAIWPRRPDLRLANYLAAIVPRSTHHDSGR